MRIASFNINGIRARFETVTRWLDEQKPDVVVLQEIKIQDGDFPREAFEDRGYRVETLGQKSFNGVALLSRLPVEDVVRGLPDPEGAGREGVDDIEARWIEGTVIGDKQAVRVCGLYLPNGNPAPGEKYDYKLRWMERLTARAAALLAEEMPAVLAGDYNVIPTPEDVRHPENWQTDALFLPQTRDAFQRLLNLGLTDAFRARVRGGGHYSYWDFQGNSWERNNGIRIDHTLLTPQAADLLKEAWIEADERGRAKPSDHVPVWIDLDA